MNEYTPDHIWSITSKKLSFERRGPFFLGYEMAGTRLTDNYSIDEVTSIELWSAFIERPQWSQVLGAPYVDLRWGVEMLPEEGFAETAPFQPNLPDSRSLFDYFHQPFLTADVGDDRKNDPINWLRVPVIDKAWESYEGPVDLPPKDYNGGFVQELSGWKPHPLQPAVDIRIFAAAGLAIPGGV